MHFQLITPESTLYTGEAAQVTMPGAAGEFGALTGHEQLVSLLKGGVIFVANEKGEEKFAVLGGVAEVKAEGISVLAEQAKPLAGLSLEDAKSELESAKAALENSVSEEEKPALERKLAMQQLVVAGLAA